MSKVGKVAGCRVTDGRSGARRERAAHPRQRRHPRRQALDAQALQGRGQGSPRPARNAAWPSRTTRTCAPATSSSATASRRSAARSERRSGCPASGLAPVRISRTGRPLISRRRPVQSRQREHERPANPSIAGQSRAGRHDHARPIAAKSGPPQRQLRVGELIRHAMTEILARGDMPEPIFARLS